MRVAPAQNITLCCVGLGSCIGFCIYDPVEKVGGMAHLVLPDSTHSAHAIPSAKYVDTGIPIMLEEMAKLGGQLSRLQVKMAGGAKMFNIPGSNGTLDVGARNIDMANNVLAKHGIKRVASDLGGNRGRTMTMLLETGKVFVRTVGQENVEL